MEGNSQDNLESLIGTTPSPTQEPVADVENSRIQCKETNHQ